MVSLYGRSITDGKGKHFYTSGRRGLYPSWPAAEVERVVLCESIIDAATLKLHTDEVVLALYGTNGLGSEHLSALDRLESLREVVLFFDGDDAGRRRFRNGRRCCTSGIHRRASVRSTRQKVRTSTA